MIMYYKKSITTILKQLCKQHRLYTTKPIDPQNRLIHMKRISDLSVSQIQSILSTSQYLKHQHNQSKSKSNPSPLDHLLKGKQVALISTKRSTRTRLAVETAITALGGSAIYLSPTDIQLGVNESVHDTAKVISRFCDLIVYRADSFTNINDLADASSVPVINGLCDTYHPTQAFADLLTITECLGSTTNTNESLSSIKVAYIGDGNNVCHSLYTILSRMHIQVRIATPIGYEPNAQIVDARHVSSDIEPVIQGARFVYTDTFVSMGESGDMEAKLAKFSKYKVTSELLDGLAHPGYQFMHCLPRKKYEVEDSVFYGPRSVVFDQAENRKWAMMAILMHALL